MSPSVIVIVVTYNRKTYLLECLQGLLTQTVKPKKILIIDNASNDGTYEYIKNNNILEDNPIIEYLKLENNTGGAGGFHHGLKTALNQVGSWFWLMDDDVSPNPNCLEKLLNYKDFSECLHPKKILPNGLDYKWEHIIDPITLGRTLLNDVSFQNGKKITYTNVGCFEGMLISRRIVELIGLPDIKYFISEDDTLYGFKASTHTNVSYVADSTMRKLIMPSTDAAWKKYYTVRNKFYLRHDLIKYLNISPIGTINNISFFIRNFIDYLNICRKNIKFLFPASKGFIDGVKYYIKSSIS